MRNNRQQQATHRVVGPDHNLDVNHCSGFVSVKDGETAASDAVPVEIIVVTLYKTRAFVCGQGERAKENIYSRSPSLVLCGHCCAAAY